LDDFGEGSMDEGMLSDKQRGWLCHVEACELTGGSMKAYAEQHALDLQSFYFWKGRLKKLGIIDAGPERRLLDRVRVQPAVPSSAAGPGKTCIQLANGVSIEAPGDFDVDALAALLAAAMRL
jgi:hypothetical protein